MTHLRQRLLEDLRLRNYSSLTIHSYTRIARDELGIQDSAGSLKEAARFEALSQFVYASV